MQNKLISICIPAYNIPQELYRLLQSIDLKQSKKIEIIICVSKREEINNIVILYIGYVSYTLLIFMVVLTYRRENDNKII